MSSKKYIIRYIPICIFCNYSVAFFNLIRQNFKNKYYLNYLSLMNYFEYKGKSSVDCASNNAESCYQSI